MYELYGVHESECACAGQWQTGRTSSRLLVCDCAVLLWYIYTGCCVTTVPRPQVGIVQNIIAHMQCSGRLHISDMHDTPATCSEHSNATSALHLVCDIWNNSYNFTQE